MPLDLHHNELERYILSCYEKGLLNDYTEIGSLGTLSGSRGYLGMSEAGHCRRQISLRLSPVKPASLKIAQRAIFKDGYLFEADTMVRLTSGGASFMFAQEEINHPSFNNIRGHTDGRMSYAEGEVLIEIKSMRGFPQQKLLGKTGRGKTALCTNVELEVDGGWVLRNSTTRQVQLAYYAQVQTYAYALKLKGQPVDEIAIIYRMKEDGRIAVERIRFDPQDAYHFWEKLESARFHSTQERMDDTDYTPGRDYNCNYCDFREPCEAVGPGVHFWHKLPEQFLEVEDAEASTDD
jgi:hypothetical protein